MDWLNRAAKCDFTHHNQSATHRLFKQRTRQRNKGSHARF